MPTAKQQQPNQEPNDEVRTLAGIGAKAREDEVMRTVIRTASACIETLLELGEEHEFDLPVTGLYVLGIAEEISCLTLEALRQWPDLNRIQQMRAEG